MGRPMFNKSLIQFSVNGQGCVPSLLLGLRPAVVGVMQPSSKGLMPAHTVVFSAPDPTAGHFRPTPLLETPGHSQANLAHSLVRTLLLSPGSWCTQGFVCALQESVSPVLWKFCNQIPLASKVKFSGIILLCPTFPCTIIALGFPAGASGKKTHLPMKESQEPQIWSLGWEDSLEEEMTPHSSILAWVTSWTEEPGWLQPIGLQRVGQDWSNLAACVIALSDSAASLRVAWTTQSIWPSVLPGSANYHLSPVFVWPENLWEWLLHFSDGWKKYF